MMTVMKVASDVQQLKASSAISTVFGSVTDVRSSQFANAEAPTQVTELGIVSEVRELQ